MSRASSPRPSSSSASSSSSFPSFSPTLTPTANSGNGEGARLLRPRLLLTALACSLLVAACGGGGGGGGGGVALPSTGTAATGNTTTPASPAESAPAAGSTPTDVAGDGGNMPVDSTPPVESVVKPSCTIEPPATFTIDTVGNQPIVDKDVYLDARVKFEAIGDIPALDVATQVRGRGNSTWLMDKKPYRLKLATSSSVLGMPRERDWALLANYSDKSLMRNSVAFCLGKMMGMKYVPKQRYAELTLNGDYVGLYQVTEHMETGASKIDIGTEDASLDNGYFLEWDNRLPADETYKFRTSPGQSPYVVKSDVTPAQFAKIQADVAEFEGVLYGPGFADPTTGYAKYIDVDSIIDLYLVNEVLRNNDAFESSTFVYRPRGGKLIFGPLWDFDIAAGNIDYNNNWLTDGFWLNTQSRYIQRLLEDPVFKARVAARWKLLAERLPDVQTFIDEGAATIDAAQRRNFNRWNILSIYVWPNKMITGSYAGEVNYLKSWLSQRSTWLDTQYTAWAQTP